MGMLGQPSQDLPPMPEDLIPALRPILVSALSQSPQMIAHNISIAQAEGTRIQEAAGLFPSLGANVQYGSNTTTTSYAASISRASLGLLYGVSATQPIYHWGALKARAEIGKIGVRIASREYAEAYRQLVVSLRAQFLALAAKKIGLRNADYALQQAEEVLAVTEERMRTKSAAPGDVNGPRLAVDEARLARDVAQEDLENSKRVFLLLAGQTDLDGQAVPDEIPRPTYSPEMVAKLSQRFLLSEGGGSLPIQNLHDNIKQADLDYRIARVQLLPRLGVGVFFGQQTQSSVVKDNQQDKLQQYVTRITDYNVVADWSIFDGFAARGARLYALNHKRSLERTLRTTVDQTMAQVRDQEKQLGFAWRSLELAQRRRDFAEDVLKRFTKETELGQSSQTEISSARAAYYQSELGLSVARGDFLDRWSQFASAIGVDPTADLIPERYLKDAK
jgi:outer membrane protein TolC